MINRDWIMRIAPDKRGQAAPLLMRLIDQPVLEDAHALLGLVIDDAELGFDLIENCLGVLAPLDAALAGVRLAMSIGQFDRAADFARSAIHLAPENGTAWFYLSAALCDQGQTGIAQMAMLRAIRSGYEHSGPWRADLFSLMIQALGEDQPRVAEIMKPCPLFGRMQQTLDSRTAALIKTCLDTNLDRFDRGLLAPPTLIPALPDDLTIKGQTILMVQNEFIHGSQANIRNDIADIYVDSAKHHGFRIIRSQAADQILHDPHLSRSPEVLRAGLARLDVEIEQVKPDIVMMDGNFLGHARTIEPAYFTARPSRGFKLVITIPDLYDRKPNVFDYWAGVADVVVHFNRRTSHVEASSHLAKALHWPGLPFEAHMFKPYAGADKTIDLCMLGSLNRGREYYARLMQGLGFPGYYLIHDRSGGQALSVEDYRARFAQAKLIFNNGTITPNQRIVTGRVFEAIYSRAVLLEESGSDVEQLYHPWVHYLPFANIHQFAALCQFMQHHEDRRQAMAQRALAWTHTHFAGRFFWASLLARLGP
jgi:hypothetical protein